VPKVDKVNYLKLQVDFLMHGVVLQNRVFGPVRPMFHVKHFCVKHAPPAPPPANSDGPRIPPGFGQEMAIELCADGAHEGASAFDSVAGTALDLCQ